MRDIFLSYASEDRDRVRPLVEKLEEHGWSVWWDQKIPPGKTWPQVISAALDSTSALMVVWTKTSVESEWVQIEAAEGKERGVLVPVRLDEVTPPLEFRRVQAADLTAWDGSSSHAQLQAAFSALEAILGVPTPTVEPRTDQTEDPAAPKRRRPWAVPALVGALVIAGAGFGVLEWQKGTVDDRTGPAGATDPAEVLVALRTDTLDADPNERAPASSQRAANFDPGLITPSDTAGRRPESPPVTTGRVIVTGLPQDGTILIDDLRQSGADFEIDVGRYVMHLAADGYLADTLILDIVGGQVQAISFSGRPVPQDQPELQQPEPPMPDSGVVLVVINPSADLWLNQVRIGRNRSFSLVVPAGSSQCIQALRDEYQTVDTAVSVAAHDTLTLVLQMRLGNQAYRPTCQRE